ncbi:hypothetical protein DSECCO2_556970 [anaerobic digester metagenome]
MYIHADSLLINGTSRVFPAVGQAEAKAAVGQIGLALFGIANVGIRHAAPVQPIFEQQARRQRCRPDFVVMNALRFFLPLGQAEGHSAHEQNGIIFNMAA